MFCCCSFADILPFSMDFNVFELVITVIFFFTYFSVFFPSDVRFLRNIQLAFKCYGIVFTAFNVYQPSADPRQPFDRPANQNEYFNLKQQPSSSSRPIRTRRKTYAWSVPFSITFFLQCPGKKNIQTP